MKEPPSSPHGVTFLGRDVESWGDRTGLIPIDPNIGTDDGLCPEYRTKKQEDNDINTQIHLVIASFRDRLCPRTLYNLFRKAENPRRIYVRIIQQLDPTSQLLDDADCWMMLLCR